SASGLRAPLNTPRMPEPRPNRPSGFSTLTPLLMLYSGKIVAVDPSVTSVPPSRTNFTSSINPSQPMPPRMSSAWSCAPRLGVSGVFLYGNATALVRGRPFTCDCALPPTCGNTITSYFCLRLPSRSLMSAKYEYGTPYVSNAARPQPSFCVLAQLWT